MPATPDPIIDVRGLVKRYRDFWGRARVEALGGIDIAIAPGESYGLLGPNGSGKTTTMKILLGLVRPTAGEVRVLGCRPGDVAALARTGFLPEESYLHPFLTGADSMDLAGRLFGLPRKERRRRSAALIERVGLEASAIARPVRTYSRGMARRLGLAQALINEPALLLLDEPTAGLDPLAARAVKNLVREVAGGGCTVLLSSHLLGDVEDLCDSVTILEKGRVVASGTVTDLLEERDALLVRIEDPPADAADRVARCLEGSGGRVASAEPPRRRLEDLFREVLGGGGDR